MKTHPFSRRDLLKSGGALIVSFAIAHVTSAQTPAQGGGRGGPRAAAMDLDSFLAVHADGTVTIFTSRVDPGTGLTAVYRQLAAEELGIPVERFTVVQGDTSKVPDHGGTGGSSGVPRGGADIRRAAATARRALLEMGASQLKRPAADPTLAGGQVRPALGGEGIAIAKLIGDKRFGIKVDANAPLKSAAAFEVIGKPVMRTDVPGKTNGRHVYVQDFIVPGIPPEKVRVVYMDGSGSYGSNGAYDCAADAALLSRAASRPVRLQWMRQDEHAWDPKSQRGQSAS